MIDVIDVNRQPDVVPVRRIFRFVGFPYKMNNQLAAILREDDQSGLQGGKVSKCALAPELRPRGPRATGRTMALSGPSPLRAATMFEPIP